MGFVLHAIWGNLALIFYTVINGFVIGFFIGLAELFFSQIQRWPYSIILVFRSILYFLITIISVYSLLLLYLKNNGMGSEALADPVQYKQISRVYFLANINTLYLLILTILASFFWQLKSFLGKGIVVNYMLGRYHKPTVEQRIFMFLDLNDATGLAEKLGSRKYSSLLSDFFNDLDSAITGTKGQVFQYVGDEVVALWNMKYGLKNNNCMHTYFLARDILQRRKSYYLEKYQVVPAFKVAFHVGEVTITEIGISKKEIVYHGDTMNTTARICASAHTLGRNILISRDLYQKLPLKSGMVFEDMGSHFLKGKDEKIQLFTITG